MPYAPLQPILDRIIVRRLPYEKKGDSFDEIIPERYRQHNWLGEVLAMGNGVVLGQEWRPLTDFLQVGQIVLFGEHTAEELEDWGDVRDGKLYVIRIQDVRGVKP